MKRKSAEVSLNRCTQEQRDMFRAAKQKEVAEWLKTEAVRRASRAGHSMSGLMRMRWILTWKDGGTRAKARLVVLGYTDPQLLELRTDAPTCSRRGRQLFLLKSAELGFSLEKGDITSAFLQSGNTQEHRQVFAEPVPELKQALGLNDDECVQILGATYGLTVAPREFYLHFSKTLQSVGARELESEPCLYAWSDQQGHIQGLVSQ